MQYLLQIVVWCWPSLHLSSITLCRTTSKSIFVFCFCLIISDLAVLIMGHFLLLIEN